MKSARFHFLSSHFCSSEKQYRFPLEYGAVRTPSAQWTVTGSGAVILSPNETDIRIDGITTGAMVDMGRRYLEKHPLTAGQVLVGRGWNQDSFTDEKRMPTRQDLDRITTDFPVIFTRACGHILCANSKALQLAGIGRDTAAVQGGEICRDGDGVPNGLVSENAISQIDVIIPPVTAEYVAQAVSGDENIFISIHTINKRMQRNNKG